MACGEKDEERMDYPILRIMSMGTEPGKMEEIYQELDVLTESELGIRVRIDFYPWDNELETAHKLINSNRCDIYVYGAAFGSGGLAQRGAFLDMKPYLEKVPALVDFYLEQGVDLSEARTVYSLPKLLSSTGFGFLYREDLRKAWGLEPVIDFGTMERYLYAAKECYTETAPINDKRFFDSLINLVAGGRYHILGYGLGIDRETERLICLLETDEYHNAVEIAKRWYQDGIISEDVLYLQDNNTMSTLEMMKQDKAALEFCNHFTAVSNNYVMPLYQVDPEWKLGWLDYELLNRMCYGNYIVNEATIGLAIGSNCLYPEQAMLLLEKMHVDSRYYNLLCYGVEGIHYRLTEDGRVSYEGIDVGNIYRGQVGLEQDSMALGQSYPDTWDDVYKDVRSRLLEMKQANGSYKAIAFCLNPSDYPEHEAVFSTYSGSRIRQLLETGCIEDVDAELARLGDELAEAGYQEFVEKVRRNWEEFRR